MFFNIKTLYRIGFLVICLLARPIFAQIQITEIMYDLDGADSGREWIEILNTGETETNPSDYKLLENEVNHKISFLDEYSGDTSIGKGEYAVIADNPTKFKIDYPNYSGILLDSAFSLGNNGENIAIINSENNIIHSVNYSPEWGAKGTGNTLQINEQLWISAIPTPGKTNSNIAADETIDDENSDNTDNTDSTDNDNTEGAENTNKTDAVDSTHSSTVDLSDYDEKTNLEVDSGRIRYGLINTPVEFIAFNNMGDDRNKVKYRWSFGDADSRGGPSPKHTYYFPGTYNIVLNAQYIDEQAVDRTKIHIRKPEMNILLINRGKNVDILLINKSDFEVNFGYFFLVLEINGEKDMKFHIPADTIVDSKSEIMIPAEVNGFVLKDMESENLVTLLLQYSNGKNAAKFDLKKQIDFSVEDVSKLNNLINPNKKQEFENIIMLLKNLKS